MQRIDAHQHSRQLARGDHGWLRADDDAVAPLRRDFLPAVSDALPAPLSTGERAPVHGMAQRFHGLA